MSKEPKYEMEAVYEVWDNKSGEHFAVGPDRDGLGLIEVRYFQPEKLECVSRLTFTPEQATMISSALDKVVNDLQEKVDKDNKL